MTKSPVEAQRSTGLILFLKTSDSTRPMTLSCVGHLRRVAQVNAKAFVEFCSIWNKKLRAAMWLGFRASRSTFQPTAMRQNGGRPPKLNPNRSAPRSLIT